jgi:hypothetical protein
VATEAAWLNGNNWEKEEINEAEREKKRKDEFIAFILISWGGGSPLLNTDPDKSLFRERASHAVRLFLSLLFAKTPARREINNIAAAISPPFCYKS